MRWQTSTLLGMGLGAAFGCGMVFLTQHLSTRGQVRSRSPLDAARKRSFDELRASLEGDHASEPRNDSWARRATEAYASDLREIAATSGSRLVDVDCRSTTCFAFSSSASRINRFRLMPSVFARASTRSRSGSGIWIVVGTNIFVFVAIRAVKA
jgi:hypothetical protein